MSRYNNNVIKKIVICKLLILLLMPISTSAQDEAGFLSNITNAITQFIDFITYLDERANCIADRAEYTSLINRVEKLRNDIINLEIAKRNFDDSLPSTQIISDSQRRQLVKTINKFNNSVDKLEITLNSLIRLLRDDYQEKGREVEVYLRNQLNQKEINLNKILEDLNREEYNAEYIRQENEKSIKLLNETEENIQKFLETLKNTPVDQLGQRNCN